MKKIMFMAAFMLLSCGTAFAQFANTSGSSTTKTRTISSTANTDTWSSLYFQWNPSSLVPDKGDNQSFTGLTLGYNHSISLMKTQPLFLEIGGALQYSFFSEEWDEDDWDSDDYDAPRNKWNMVSVKVPISVTYNWQVSDKVAIAPYLGLTMRLNVWGDQKVKFDGDFVDDVEDYYGKNSSQYETIEEAQESKNIFDKNDMGGKDATANRFQLGWQIGVNFKFNNKFYIGAAYGSDFMEYSKKVKISQPSITVGLIF